MPKDEPLFLDELLAAGLLIATGVPGLHGRGEAFERVIHAFDALVTDAFAAEGAEVVRFPPVLPRRQLEQSGYLGSFPHLAGSVFCFTGDEAEARDLAARAARRTDWSDLQTMTDVMLTPAACYPVYPWVSAAGRLPAGGRRIDVSGNCFRHEHSNDPSRMQSFRMHELVRVGEAAEVAEWRAAWIERGGELLASVGLATDAVPATDPFFGRGAMMMAVSQREQNLKIERVYPIAAGKPTAIMSINYHVDHFGLDFEIATSDEQVAHSACVAFGLERVTLALFRAHGLSREAWPTDIRDVLGL